MKTILARSFTKQLVKELETFMARPHPKTAMTRGILALLLCLISVPALSQIYRAKHTPMDAATLTAVQKKQMDKVDAKYGAPFEALMKKDHSDPDWSDKLDALNRQYSKAILGVMTDKQKLDYLHAVYEHVMDFLHSHPDMTFEQVFVWGGAYAIGPNVDHLPKNFPG